MPPKKRKTLIDLGRVIGPEPLSHLGNIMIRHPHYFRGLVLLVMTSAISNSNYKQATLSVIILFSIRAIGMLLKFGPALLLNRLKKTAYLAGHRFNVAQKRCRVMAHSHLFWENIYEPEARTLYLPEEIAEQADLDQKLTETLRQNLRQLPLWAGHELQHTETTEHYLINALQQARPVSCGIECTAASFNTSFMHALQVDYDRVTQTHLTGLNVNAIEDYMCSPILGERDAFPSQNWAGNRQLSQLRNRLTHYTPPKASDFSPNCTPRLGIVRNLHRLMWHSLVTNVITKRTGTAIRKLNRLCHTEEINVQTLLWPECAEALWIRQYDGLYEAITTIRQHMLDQAFGETEERAEVMIERLTRWDELQAMHLRAQCDIRYINPAEPINLYTDYEALEDYSHKLPAIQRFMESAQAELALFEEWLKQHAQQWAEQLKCTPAARMQQVAHFMIRLRQFIQQQAPDELPLLHQYGAQLEQALLYYTSDDDLIKANIPEQLIQLTHQHVEALSTAETDLFALPNREALRAVLTAFHGNMRSLRHDFQQYTDQPEDTAIHTQLLLTVGEIIEQRTQISTEVLEQRTHHSLCKIHRLLYTEFVEQLRYAHWPTRRERIRQRVHTLHETISLKRFRKE